MLDLTETVFKHNKVHNKSVKQITESSAALKEHLLRKSILKKVLMCHKIYPEKIEQVLINISCLKDARLDANSKAYQKSFN